MAEEYRVDLTVGRNDIVDEARDAAKALDEVPESIETRLELNGVDRAIGELDRLTQDAAATATAAEELGRALGPELAAKADLSAVVGELQKLGTEIDEITVNADQFAAKLREAADANVGGGLGQALGTARGETEKLRDSARGANSALANMVGNTAQDLGALTGVVGSLGVGLGQMGEYAADAAFGGEKLSSALGSMVKVAGPIAALGVGVGLLNAAMQKGSDAAENHAEGIERVSAAAEEGTGLIGALRDQIEETSKLRFQFGGGFDTSGLVVDDLRENLANLNLELEDFVRFTEMSGDEAGRYADSLVAGGAAEKDVIALHVARLELKKQLDAATLNNALNDAIGANASKEAGELIIDGLEQITEARERSADAAREDVERTKAAAEAMEQWAIQVQGAEGALRELDDVFSGIGIRADALTQLFDLGNAPLDAAAQVRDIGIAIGELSDVAKGVHPMDIVAGNVKADPLLDAIDALRPDVQAKVVEAFSAGGPEAATALASSYIDQVTAELGGKMTREDVARLLGLENIEATVAVALEMSAVETARRQLAILTGLNGETPWSASIALALDAGTITGEQAQALIQERLAGAGVRVPSELQVDTAAAEETVAGFAAGDQPAATVEVIGDTAPAAEEVEGFTSADYDTTVAVDSDTAEAARKMLALITTPRVAQIIAMAITTQAAIDLRQLADADRTARIDVRTGSVDLPTATELANRIGTIRVPIDTYIRNDARIGGVRD